ncbi:MAG: ATP-binding cassette domain-containing protein [Clostridiales Family XIII bacterium]|jgi:cell division transport system ATP-binding protein|nr:ATP-binding cassette domain-containing protein [Clostridiales Family XIII bacterium]
MIEYKNVTKLYGDKVGIKDVSIQIDDGEFVFLVGPSGAGKSTFVKLLLRIINADAGTILYNGYDVTDLDNVHIPKHRRSMGIIFQDFSLLPKKTVYENIAFAMEIIQKPHRMMKEQITRVLELVGLTGEEKKYPHELSIGEQQRVAIARAIVNNPSILIADEPTGNLDPVTGWEIMKILDKINKRGTTVIMVTHSQEIVNAMDNRVVAIEDGLIVRDEERGNYRPEDDSNDNNAEGGIFSL